MAGRQEQTCDASTGPDSEPSAPNSNQPFQKQPSDSPAYPLQSVGGRKATLRLASLVVPSGVVHVRRGGRQRSPGAAPPLNEPTRSSDGERHLGYGSREGGRGGRGQHWAPNAQVLLASRNRMMALRSQKDRPDGGDGQGVTLEQAGLSDRDTALADIEQKMNYDANGGGACDQPASLLLPSTTCLRVFWLCFFRPFSFCLQFGDLSDASL
jgi:hypothetical protein